MPSIDECVNRDIAMAQHVLQGRRNAIDVIQRSLIPMMAQWRERRRLFGLFA